MENGGGIVPYLFIVVSKISKKILMTLILPSLLLLCLLLFPSSATQGCIQKLNVIKLTVELYITYNTYFIPFEHNVDCTGDLGITL